MEFSQRQAALAARLLARFGANGTLTPAPTYDPLTDRMSATGSGAITVRMVLGPMETVDQDGREAFRTVARMQTRPERGGTIAYAGATYTVGDVTVIAPQGLPIIYQAEVS